MDLSERLARLEAIVAEGERLARDLTVIRMQLERAEGTLERGGMDVRRELRIVEQRLARAERRLTRAIGEIAA